VRILKLLALLLAAVLGLPAIAQIPNTLKHSIPAPPVGVQSSAQLGYSVAVDGGYTVVGVPFDDIGASDSGVVKVFDSTTGALLFVLPNPGPAADDLFGISVAISGTRVVVGAPYDDTGASNTGSAYVYDLSSGTPTVPVATLLNPGPAVGDLFGYAVAISGTRVVVGAYADDTGATNAGSAYVYDLGSGAPTVAVATLSNPTPAAYDSFGSSVGISGTRVVVGAAQDSTGAPNAGSAYVYDLGSATPTVPMATLNKPSPGYGDLFGNSVAISGTRVVVGAFYDDTGATDAGSAYVYDLGSGTPTMPVATLNNPGPTDDDWFGISVAISGTRVVVGAAQDSTGAPYAGSAYVYDLGSGTPTVPVATLNNPGPAANDNFGSASAISGMRVVVGAYLDDTGANSAGSAYVYDLSSGTPTMPVAMLNNPGPALNDNFGYSVAISGTRVVVGVPYDDTGATNSGIAYLYDLSSSTPTVPIATLNNPTPAAEDQFGNTVTISGTRVVVGAWGDDTGATNAGTAYVYDLSSGTPTVPVVTLSNPSPASGDGFGCSVAISGTRVVVGASGDDTEGANAGSAYVYDLGSGTPTVPVATLSNPGAGLSNIFGSSVAISGARVVVGAQYNDTGAKNAGSAYVYNLDSGTPTLPVTTLNNPNPAQDDEFGSSVAISGTRVVVGAHRDDTGAPDGGSVYVYDLSSGTPTVPVATLNNPGQASSDYGYSVAISGTRVVVGAHWDKTGADYSGIAYVYDFSSGTPTVPVATLNNPSPGVFDDFGRSVAISGTTVAIGTPRDDTTMLDKGAAYIFGPAVPAGPEIAVEQPAGSSLVDGGGAPSFGGLVIGTSGTAKVFTIKNSGTADLTGLLITKDGTHSSDYILSTTGMATTLIPGGSTTFTVTFFPGGVLSATRTAAIHIASNDLDENPFDITLTGQALSTTTDTDGDGLTDWAEFQYAALGFDWQVSQPALVNTLNTGANAANLYTPTQVQALYVGTPLIQRNPATGVFTLTIGIEKSADLINYAPFPFTSPGTTINAQGKLEFMFDVPDNAAFFRLETR
jgi:FG-GAP repeat